MNSLQDINSIIGRTVLSLETANTLGVVHDFVVDPRSGRMAGLAVQRPNESFGFVDQSEIHSLGPDAVMVEEDKSMLTRDQSPLSVLPLAKNQLVKVKVLTKSGQLLGRVANVFIHLAQPPTFVYEVRFSVMDKLLGRGVFFRASLAGALADDGTSLLVSDNTEEMDRSLQSVVKRLSGPGEILAFEPAAVRVTVRSHAE